MPLFKDLARLYNNRTALHTDDGFSLAYNDLIRFCSEQSKYLRKRSLVFCLCKNVPGSLCGYISFLNNGVVPLMLEANMDTDFINDLINKYKPDYLWLPDSRVQEFSSSKIIFSAYSYTLIEISSENRTRMDESLALLLTTSGSTGSPKLVRLSYNNIKANAKSIIKYLDIDSNERPITTLPMSYSFGLSIINSHLLQGACILLTSKTLIEKEFWVFLKNNSATSLSGVPYTYEMLKKLKFFNLDLPSLRTMAQAGGKMNNDLNLEFAEYCKKSNKRFFVMYGQTEATARMSYLPPEYSISKLGSMGVAIPGGEFSLIDDEGNVITESETIGELVYKGENVSLGYAECAEDLIKNDENNGVLITGDLARRDSDGFYYIVGRKKRFIKIYGNRVNLDETERMLKNLVSDCACTGIDDHLIIYITKKDKMDDIRKFIMSKTKINHIAFSVRYIDEIPKNSSGKTTYSSLPK